MYNILISLKLKYTKKYFTPSQSFLVAWMSDHRTPYSLPLPHSRFDSSLSGVR